MEKSQTIYCIGDSHINFLSGYSGILPEYPDGHKDGIPLFKTYRLGATLAYNLSRTGTKTRGREKLFSLIKNIPKGSRIMLCFGEIDCRAHLIKQSIKQRRRIKDIVKECVIRYFSVIQELTNMGYRVIVFGVIPSTMFNMEFQEYPTFGSCLERNNVTKLFNQQLSTLSKRHNITYISIFNNLVRNDGLTRMYYYIDPIHLSIKALPFLYREIENKIPEIDSNLFKFNTFSPYINYIFYYYIRRPLHFAKVIVMSYYYRYTSPNKRYISR